MIHVYCGDGKGKTTAALGLALRAAGSSMKVVLVQFLKGRHSGELAALDGIPNVVVLRGENSPKFAHQMTPQERESARRNHGEMLARARALVEGTSPCLLILDEACAALSTGLLGEDSIKALLGDEFKGVELVFTGRNPPGFLLEAADYVTEMKCRKHPYEQGVPARKGIEY